MPIDMLLFGFCRLRKRAHDAVRILILATCWSAAAAQNVAFAAESAPSPDPVFALLPDDGGSTPAADGTTGVASVPKSDAAPESRNWLMSGYVSHHFGAPQNPPLNDWNAGVFYEHDFNRTWGFMVGEFKNSGFIQSKLIAADYTALHAGDFSVDVMAGFLSGYVQLGHGRLSPAALPYLSYSTRLLRTNLYCVPAVVNNKATCGLQFGVNLGPR